MLCSSVMATEFGFKEDTTGTTNAAVTDYEHYPHLEDTLTTGTLSSNATMDSSQFWGAVNVDAPSDTNYVTMHVYELTGAGFANTVLVATSDSLEITSITEQWHTVTFTNDTLEAGKKYLLDIQGFNSTANRIRIRSLSIASGDAGVGPSDTDFTAPSSLTGASTTNFVRLLKGFYTDVSASTKIKWGIINDQ